MNENYSSENTLLNRLKERRFFPLFGSYLLGGWALVQFIDWISERYALSTIYSETALILFLCFIPAAVLLIYRHGAPGNQAWSTFEKGGLALNSLLAFALVILRANSLPVEAPVQENTLVKTIDEEGQNVNRVIPEATSTRRIAILPFSNKTNSEELNWMRYGIARLIDIDLEQDSRLLGLSSFSFFDGYQNHGHSITDDIPFATQRNIANDVYTDLFIQGAFSKTDDLWNLEIKAFTSEDGKEFYNHTFNGSDFNSLIDDFTIAFKENLELADVSNSQQRIIDLPTDGLISSNLEALEYYFKSHIAHTVNNDFTSAIKLVKKAIDKDPNCTECIHSLYRFYDDNGQAKESKESILLAMKNSDHLSERQKLAIKHAYYLSTDNIEKVMALNDMWRKFYPNDYKPYSNLFHSYLRRSEYGEAIKLGEEALSKGHTGDILLMMANLEVARENPESAKKYLERFSQKFPNRLNETVVLANVYSDQGEFEKAREHLEKLQILDPLNIDLFNNLIFLEGRTGNFKKAEKHAKDALAQAKTTRDSVNVLYQKELLLRYLGKGNEAIDILNKRHQLQNTYTSPMEGKYEFLNYQTMVNYLEAGQKEVIEEEMKFFTENNSPEMHLLKCAVQVNYSLATKDLHAYKTIDKECREIIILRQGPVVYKLIDGFVAGMNKDYKLAANTIQEYLDEVKIKTTGLELFQVEMYLKDKQYEKAKTKIENQLVSYPMDPKILVEKAKVEKELGNTTEAKEWLNKALEIWKDADETYVPAKEARALVL